MGFRGYVDACSQWHVTGWAAKDAQRTPATVRVNGQVLTRDAPIVRRPDLTIHGIDETAGFTLLFPDAVGLADVVEVCFSDGSHLVGSPSVTHHIRLRELLDGIEPHMQGLELGPLDRPIVPKRSYNVRYVDHASRQELMEKYTRSATNETLDRDRIVPVDVVWPGGPLAPCLADQRPLDYCLASHVIEHVADVIGWLQQLASVLRDGGIVSLAIPDKERTFDHARAVSRPADLIEAHLRCLNAPSARHVFDHITSVSPFGEPVSPPAPALIREALQHARAVMVTDLYVDVHCYVFTQQSFREVFSILGYTGLLPFRLRRFFPTRPGANEFIVSLRKCTDSPESIAESYLSNSY